MIFCHTIWNPPQYITYAREYLLSPICSMWCGWCSASSAFYSSLFGSMSTVRLAFLIYSQFWVRRFWCARASASDDDDGAQSIIIGLNEWGIERTNSPIYSCALSILFVFWCIAFNQWNSNVPSLTFVWSVICRHQLTKLMIALEPFQDPLQSPVVVSIHKDRWCQACVLILLLGAHLASTNINFIQSLVYHHCLSRVANMLQLFHWNRVAFDLV